VDLLDRASEAEQRERDAALAKMAAKAPAAGDWDRVSAKWCTDAACGQRIPDARRRAFPGVTFCVECQERHEQEERRSR
jgi:phage/conjugal plasmid C-4 type zinc finger TraR family protein